MDGPYISRWMGPTRWQVAADWNAPLLGETGVLRDWPRLSGPATIIKQGAHRTVYRLDLPAGTIYLKHAHNPAWWDTGRSLFQASVARREFDKAREVARRGIATFRPLAWAERVVGGLVVESLLVTAAVNGAQPLFAALGQDELPRFAEPHWLARRRLGRTLARFCAQVHRAGIRHNDFHGGNLLAHRDGSGEWTLALVDLPGIELGDSLPWERCREGLAMLHSEWHERCSLAERWRFWRHYVRERADLRLSDPRAAAAEVVEQARDHARRILAGRVKRSLRNNRDFHALTRPRGTGHAVRALDRATLSSLIDDPDQLLRVFAHRPVKLSHSSLVVEAELIVDGRPEPIAYKRVTTKGVCKRMARVCRRRRTLNAWVMGHTLNDMGIATPEPLAVVVPTGTWRGVEGYLATRWIPGARNLHLYAWELAARPAEDRRRQTRAGAVVLGRLLGRMHDWRVSHRDLKGLNLLVEESATGLRAWLLDLDCVRLERRSVLRRQVRELARLAASMTAHVWLTHGDRLRFLRAYCSARGPDVPPWRTLWRAIATEAGAYLSSRRRRGVPIA